MRVLLLLLLRMLLLREVGRAGSREGAESVVWVCG